MASSLPTQETFCLTCSSSLTSPTSTLPSHSEKPDPPTLTYPCGHVICGRCQRKNRRLTRGCLLCESVNDLLGSAEGQKPPSASGSGLPVYEEEVEEVAKEEFIIGDEDDDEDEKVDVDAVPTPDSPPPYYEEGDVVVPAEKAEGGDRAQCSIHYIKPADTLAGLSLHYRCDGALLCRMNKLPTSTLSTTPHLLHTLPFLLLPPSTTSSSLTPAHPPEIERQRLVLRRFQVRTRCADWAFSNAYVSAVFDRRKKEAEFVSANRMARGGAGDEIGIREGGELEEAIADWEKDQKWEKDQMNTKGKGKVVGSKLRSTGLVERDAKSWSWR